MLTLLVTVLATAYFVVPELLTRFIVSFYFVRKATTGTRSEELLRAASWAIVPLLLAWTIRNVGPWPVPAGMSHSTQVVFASLYSGKLFEQDPSAFYAAFAVFTKFNLCLLARAYTLVILGSVLFGWIATRLGTFRQRLRGWPRVTRVLHFVFMPRISEWHVALSPMLVHDRGELIVRIDVMTKGGLLYRGNVYEKRIKADGDLATLVLENVQRLVRTEYLHDRAVYEEQKAASPKLKKPDTEDYWKKIPGELFLLNGSEIASINVRHVRPVGILRPSEDQELLKAFAAINEQLKKLMEERANDHAS